MNKKWTESEIGVLRQNYGKIINREICKLLNGRSRNSIFNKAKKIGLKSNQRVMASVAKKKWIHDKFFFAKKSLPSLYWAGFIAADGNIQKSNSAIQIKLQNKDTGHLERFKFDIQYSGNILKGFCTLNGCIYPYSILNLYSAKELLHDLSEIYNIKERKSLTLLPPNIYEYEEILSFIIGYIDGDGCISHYLQKRKYPTVEVSMVGSHQFLTWVRRFVSEEMDIKISPVLKQGNIFNIRIYGKEARLFIEKTKCISVPRMTRKWKNYEKK